MTTYIFVLLFIIIVLLVAILMRKPVFDISALREDNARLRERLAERLGVLAQNANELKNISGDIANFKNILMGNKQARGTFGERQLEDLVADIMPPETYAFQSVMETGVRPDCIIRLPYPPGDMIIDSKFPLESYNRLLDEPNDAMIKKQFDEVLKNLKVAPIEAVGNDFDPNFHNAVMHVEDESIAENTVVEEFMKGYIYKDSRVVRHSMVKVAN